jgi:hypothetical protein
VPWTLRYVAAQASRHHLGIDDLWDEALTALLRVSLYADFVSGNPTGRIDPRMHYAQTAVRRACWRYVIRQALKRPRTYQFDGCELERPAPSVEEELIARESVAARVPALPPPCSTVSDAPAVPVPRVRRAATRAG